MKFIDKSTQNGNIQGLTDNSAKKLETDMLENNTDPMLDKAQVFFDRAAKAAMTNNFDYAIEMYLEGLRCAPDALEQGHLKLYALALHRQVKGGKKPAMMEKIKRARSKKIPLEQMLDAEYLFAKDPDHIPYAESMLKAAVAADCVKTARWIADLIFQANNAAEKPSLQTYLLLKDSYSAIEEYDRALAACQQATRIKPEDSELNREFKRLSAELTVSKGRYDQSGDFRDSINNRQVQERRQMQAGVVKTEDYRLDAVQQARKALEQDPDMAKNIFNLANVLSELENDNGENQAVELLLKAYETKTDFSFKQRAGEIRIKQIKRKLRKLQTAAELKTTDIKLKKMIATLGEQLKNVELKHYQLCAENYPTDLQVKYEYATRLVKNKRYDDAIGLLQEASKDPRHKISAMSKIGLCFFRKAWYADAIDIFSQAMEAHNAEDDSTAKELKYNLARAYEEQGNCKKALEIFRKIAQIDFSYKDVRTRVDNLRKKDTD